MTAVRRKRLTEKQDNGSEVVQPDSRARDGAGGSRKLVPIASLRLDGGTQPRASIHADWVAEYAQDMTDGGTFPPVTVFFDGVHYWLGDGFHRTMARQANGDTEIECDVRQGSQRDAVLFSCSANATHGQRRTNEDKRRAVLLLLHDAEWAQWSNREIARRTGVSDMLVADLRSPVTANSCSDERTVRTKHGTVTTMNTANIGRRPQPEPEEDADDEPPTAMPVAPARSAPLQPTQVQVDFEATLRAQGAWAEIVKAVKAIAALPSPDTVIDVVMRTSSYGEKFETFESAIAWLNAFLPLYRDAEPRRWKQVNDQLNARLYGGKHG